MIAIHRNEDSVNVEGRHSPSLHSFPHFRGIKLPEHSGVVCQVGATGRSRTA